jgi:glycosyltransferase involved in cell wall biosynthesis
MNSSAVRWGNTLFEMVGKKAWPGCALAYCWHMNWKAHCAVVIPCLNEAAIIENVVTAARDYLPNVFIVDDGSSDSTAAVAKEAGAEVLRHESPRGKGAALQTGWSHLREKRFTWALTMDGDGQHAAEDIPRFLECAERTAAKLVVGNRMDNPTGMPRVRRFVNRWMSARLSALTGVSLPDSQCGFRLMNLDAWAELPVNAAHFEIESDVLAGFAARGYPIEFVPIQVIYKTEQSKIHPVRDTIRWFKWWRRTRSCIRHKPPSRGENGRLLSLAVPHKTRSR